MAFRPTEKSYGYESCRFEKDVDENLHCSICYNVLKEPRTCRNNDHIFCLACISEHLTVNSQTCPECNEHLSVDTLRRPRVLNNILSNLKIKCDYASRGCPEFVCVADLKRHAENCGFAPALCSNKECGMEINKQDKVHHETEVCEYRKLKCRECGQAQNLVGRLEGFLTDLDEKVEAIKEEQQEIKVEIKNVKEEVEEIKKSQQEVKKVAQDVKKEVREVKQEVTDVKENLSKANKDVDEVKVMMRQMMQKLNVLERLNKWPSPTEGVINTPKEDILITGRFGYSGRSTEIFSWEKNGWVKITEMNEAHAGASSFVYKGRLFVVGGEGCKTIDALDLNVLPLKWMKFSGKLPYRCDDHQTVVYQQRVIHIGGYNYDKRERSNVISELQLTSTCAMKELCKMPEPRGCHSAEIFEDKIFIMGGENGDGALDSVLKFDATKNEYTEMPPLPHALSNMATVRWRDKVVVIGGKENNNEVLNDVFMYDCKTGKTIALPSMLQKRSRSCAIITGNTIVVMGGCDNDDKDLNSVECFTMGGSTWEYLSAMNVARWGAVAEVLPSGRKYV